MPSVLLSRSVTCQCRDYLGADNAGLHALLLQRGGPGGEGEQIGTEFDFRTIKRVHVVKDLYDVLAWARGSLRRSLLRLFCFSGDTSKCMVQ